MRKRSRGAFLIAIIAAVLLIFLVMMMQRRDPGPGPGPIATPIPQQQTRVLVAKTAIPEGTKLTANDLHWQVWPRDGVPKNAITQAQRPQAHRDLAGFLVRSSFSANEFISDSKLVPPDGAGWVASILPNGQRLVTFSVNELRAGGGFIQPKDKVDVVMTPRGGNDAEPVAILLVNVPVFAINGFTDPISLAASQPNVKTVRPTTITVQVSIEEANLLLEVSRFRELMFNLRPFHEEGGTAVPFEDTRTIPLTVQKFDKVERSR